MARWNVVSSPSAASTNLAQSSATVPSPASAPTTTSAALPCGGDVPDDEVHLVARVVEVAGSRPHEDVHLG
jgi:hypothetical protein